MRQKAYHRLALRELKKPERLIDLAEYQQDKVRELESRSQSDLAIAIQQCYRHIFYPSRDRIGDSDVDLAHTAIDVHSASEQPGAGQKQIIRSLRDLNKLRLSEDEPDSPAYIRDRTPLKKGANFHVCATQRVPARSGAADIGRRRDFHSWHLAGSGAETSTSTRAATFCSVQAIPHRAS